MKRFGAALALAFVGTILAGCEGGLKEGQPDVVPQSAQTDQFKETMRKTQEKMQMKGKPKMAPAAPAAPAEAKPKS